MLNFKLHLPKKAFCVKSAKPITIRSYKLRFTPVCVNNQRLPAKMRFAICAKNTTRFSKLRFHPFLVKNRPLPKLKPFLPKNVFCVKAAQKIQFVTENCVFSNFLLETGFVEILNLSYRKERFACNLGKEHNSLLKIAFYSILSWRLGFTKFKASLAQI